mmetsp:Transcript_23559/g.34247  ORF Transcript_23559/g.34247 Transcript_23559/m.34247 type:complete len:137 (-) Transcript_23559:168-578(-)
MKFTSVIALVLSAVIVPHHSFVVAAEAAAESNTLLPCMYLGQKGCDDTGVAATDYGVPALTTSLSDDKETSMPSSEPSSLPSSEPSEAPSVSTAPSDAPSVAPSAAPTSSGPSFAIISNLVLGVIGTAVVVNGVLV